MNKQYINCDLKIPLPIKRTRATWRSAWSLFGIEILNDEPEHLFKIKSKEAINTIRVISKRININNLPLTPQIEKFYKGF